VGGTRRQPSLKRVGAISHGRAGASPGSAAGEVRSDRFTLEDVRFEVLAVEQEPIDEGLDFIPLASGELAMARADPSQAGVC